MRPSPARVLRKTALVSILVAACGLATAQTPILGGYGDAGDDDSLGSSVAVVGDVNGDGHDDIVVGVPNDGDWCHGGARVLSGLDGSELLHWEGANEYDRLGVSVAGVGDLDADGVPDVLVGAPQRDLFGNWGQLTLSTTWPAGVPAGVELYLQAWVVDPAGPAGFAAGPAIVGVTP